MSWRNEFGASYAPPAEVLAAGDLRDVSYGNDVCPSFTLAAADALSSEEQPLLFSHPADPKLREYDGPRFIVLHREVVLFEGDDVQAALVALRGAQ